MNSGMRTLVQHIKYSIKLSMAFVLFYSGILHLYKYFMMRNRMLVLMYHRVLPLEQWRHTFSSRGIIVSDTTFAKQMAFLKKHFNIININEFIINIANARIGANNSCLITFDDGWSDNYAHAFSILTSFSLPAIIFLPTKFISNSERFWQEKLSRLLYTAYLNRTEGSALLTRHARSLLDARDHEDAKRIIAEYVTEIKSLGIDDISELINKLESSLIGASVESDIDDIDTYMSWDQISEMHDNGIDFGSHSVNHHILTKLDDEHIQSDLADSKHAIEKNLDCTIPALAYPNGNYSKVIMKIAEDCGYKVAFTTEEGWVRRQVNPFCIKRINIHEYATRNLPLFYCRLLGIL